MSIRHTLRLTIASTAVAALLVPAFAQDQDGLVAEPSVRPAPVVESEAATPANAVPATPGPSGETSVAQTKDPASGLELNGLMKMLSETMKGQPVIAVNAPYTWRYTDITNDEDYKHARSLIEKLQAIAETQREPDNERRSSDALIPFKVGNAYALAPETREGVNFDLSGITPLEASSRGTLLMDTLLGLTPAQLRQVGSEQGLAVSSLPEALRIQVQQSFRPRLRLIDIHPSTFVNENGIQQMSEEHQPVSSIETPFDWSRVRLRARLRMTGANVTINDMGTVLGYNRASGATLEPLDDNNASWSEGGVSLPLFQRVPNKYKASDLEGRRFTQPLGMSGVWNVGDVVKQLGQRTGLKMSAWWSFGKHQVFLGSPSLTVGEVIDGLRLAMDASWRKLGDTYILSWDRVPLLAIQQAARESAYETLRQVRRHRRELETDPRWMPLLQALPFAPDDPLALTTEQRERLFFPKTDETKDRPGPPQGIPYTELTPGQQAYLKAQSEKETLHLPSRGPDQPELERPYTEEDVRSSELSGQGNIDVSLLIPEHGWVRASESWEGLYFHPWLLQRIRQKAASNGEKRDILEDAPKEVREMLENMKPMPLPATMRAAVVPTLGPARLNELADEMQRHGLNTLFYPVLIGGYATFPSKAFPLDPALRGEDGWTAAVRAMKPKGIRVIGYLNTLAWQNAEDRAHWLNKYPQWQDVDVLGRTRLAWISAHPTSLNPMSSLGMARANYVRASEPAVRARLKALVAEYAARRDAVGIAFSRYLPDSSMGLPSQSLFPPPLGFATADRLAAFQRTGQDPADIVQYDDYMPASLRDSGRWNELNRDQPADDPNLTLVAELMSDGKQRRPDWKTYLISDGNSRIRRSPTTDLPLPDKKGAVRPDIVISSLFAMGGPDGTTGMLFPIGTGNFFSALQDAEQMPDSDMIPKKLLELPSIAVFGLIWSSEPQMKSRTMPAIALDFREAPQMITESLRWVEPPEPPAKTAATGKTAATAQTNAPPSR